MAFITVVESVYCAVRTDTSYKADYVSYLKGKLLMEVNMSGFFCEEQKCGLGCGMEGWLFGRQFSVHVRGFILLQTVLTTNWSAQAPVQRTLWAITQRPEVTGCIFCPLIFLYCQAWERVAVNVHLHLHNLHAQKQLYLCVNLFSDFYFVLRRFYGISCLFLQGK